MFETSKVARRSFAGSCNVVETPVIILLGRIEEAGA